jgi:hypothetical protein
VHDVAICENQAIGREQKAGAPAAALLGLVSMPLPHRLMDFDVYDRRSHSLDGRGDRAGIGVQQKGIVQNRIRARRHP